MGLGNSADGSVVFGAKSTDQFYILRRTPFMILALGTVMALYVISMKTATGSEFWLLDVQLAIAIAMIVVGALLKYASWRSK